MGAVGLSLREITSGMTLAASLLEEDLAPEQRAEVETALRQLAAEELPRKAEGYAAIMVQLAAEADALDAEEKRLATRRRKREATHEWMRATLLAAMQTAGVTKMVSARFTVSVQANPPRVDIYDESLLPREYLVPVEPPAPRVDRKAISAVIKAGGTVPGARLVQGESLRIR